MQSPIAFAAFLSLTGVLYANEDVEIVSDVKKIIAVMAMNVVLFMVYPPRAIALTRLFNQ